MAELAAVWRCACADATFRSVEVCVCRRYSWRIGWCGHCQRRAERRNQVLVALAQRLLEQIDIDPSQEDSGRAFKRACACRPSRLRCVQLDGEGPKDLDCAADTTKFIQDVRVMGQTTGYGLRSMLSCGGRERARQLLLERSSASSARGEIRAGTPE
eukprot:5219559-Pyramimonas_sp.AAC.1